MATKHKITTKENIISYITGHDTVQPKELIDHFQLHPTLIHRYLKDLLQEGVIRKLGTVPKVYYALSKKDTSEKLDTSLSYKEISFLNTTFYNYSADGNLLEGYEGFVQWCGHRDLDIKKQYEFYCAMRKNKENLKNRLGLIPANAYLDARLGKVAIDNLYYIDAYQIGHFGRSPLGSMTFYAKQSQNRALIIQIINIIKQPIQSFILKNHIDAVCFIPPSIKRKVQFMSEIQKGLNLDLPHIIIEKFFPTQIVIPQKSLKEMKQRIRNAENTLFLPSKQKPIKNILLIDDFVGSGATLNITAQKLKSQGIAKRIYAISILGNVDTKYDVISEI